MTRLLIESCSPTSSIQDGGRRGWQRFGLSCSGALDVRALALANALVGNHPQAPAIELLRLGMRIRALDGDVRLAIAGAPFPISIDGDPVAGHTSFILSAGKELVIAHCRAGVCGVLAVEGGIAVEPELGSASLHLRGEVGGLGGRPLLSGDQLPVGRRAKRRPELMADPLVTDEREPIRVLLGPQHDRFSENALQLLLSATFHVGAECDRMGYRLTGPAIPPQEGRGMISDGVADGSIQIPGSGQPIVLLADRQTTGGYPKIATIITPDIARLAHRRPGDPVCFTAVSIEEAQALHLEWREQIAGLPRRLRPACLKSTASERLMPLNFAGAAVNAADPATWLGGEMPEASSNAVA